MKNLATQMVITHKGLTVLLVVGILASGAFPAWAQRSEVFVANELYSVANGLAAVGYELDGLIIHLTVPPSPVFPPSPVGPVNELGAMVTQLDGLEARLLAAYPDPGPPGSPVTR